MNDSPMHIKQLTLVYSIPFYISLLHSGNDYLNVTTISLYPWGNNSAIQRTIARHGLTRRVSICFERLRYPMYKLILGKTHLLSKLFIEVPIMLGIGRLVRSHVSAFTYVISGTIPPITTSPLVPIPNIYRI